MFPFNVCFIGGIKEPLKMKTIKQKFIMLPINCNIKKYKKRKHNNLFIFIYLIIKVDKQHCKFSFHYFRLEGPLCTAYEKKQQ